MDQELEDLLVLNQLQESLKNKEQQLMELDRQMAEVEKRKRTRERRSSPSRSSRNHVDSRLERRYEDISPEHDGMDEFEPVSPEPSSMADHQFDLFHHQQSDYGHHGHDPLLDMLPFPQLFPTTSQSVPMPTAEDVVPYEFSIVYPDQDEIEAMKKLEEDVALQKLEIQKMEKEIAEAELRKKEEIKEMEKRIKDQEKAKGLDSKRRRSPSGRNERRRSRSPLSTRDRDRASQERRMSPTARRRERERSTERREKERKERHRRQEEKERESRREREKAREKEKLAEKEKEKDKPRDRDREKEKERERQKEKDKEREKEKEKSRRRSKTPPKRDDKKSESMCRFDRIKLCRLESFLNDMADVLYAKLVMLKTDDSHKTFNLSFSNIPAAFISGDSPLYRGSKHEVYMSLIDLTCYRKIMERLGNLGFIPREFYNELFKYKNFPTFLSSYCKPLFDTLTSHDCSKLYNEYIKTGADISGLVKRFEKIVMSATSKFWDDHRKVVRDFLRCQQEDFDLDRLKPVLRPPCRNFEVNGPDLRMIPLAVAIIKPHVNTGPQPLMSINTLQQPPAYNNYGLYPPPGVPGVNQFHPPPFPMHMSTPSTSSPVPPPSANKDFISPDPPAPLSKKARKRARRQLEQQQKAQQEQQQQNNNNMEVPQFHHQQQMNNFQPMSSYQPMQQPYSSHQQFPGPSSNNFYQQPMNGGGPSYGGVPPPAISQPPGFFQHNQTSSSSFLPPSNGYQPPVNNNFNNNQQQQQQQQKSRNDNKTEDMDEYDMVFS